ncbi:MAG: inositol monophosphatase family protein [Alphaproteobacteria bacterium]
MTSPPDPAPPQSGGPIQAGHVPDDLLQLAGRMADATGEICRRHFRQPLAIDSKADESPVTIADRTCEQALRRILAEERPDDSIIGEEFGASEGSSDLTWVLDPIDGTKQFISGKPLFGTLIACWRGHTPLLGVIDHPAMGERWLGALGRPTTLNGIPVHVAAGDEDLSRTIIHAGDPAMFSGEAQAAGFARLAGAVSAVVYGGDCYNYGLLASGHVLLCVDARLKPYDFAALVPVVTGAGGCITDWSGDPLTLASSGDVVAAAAALHGAALARLSAGRVVGNPA